MDECGRVHERQPVAILLHVVHPSDTVEDWKAGRVRPLRDHHSLKPEILHGAVSIIEDPELLLDGVDVAGEVSFNPCMEICCLSRLIAHLAFRENRALACQA